MKWYDINEFPPNAGDKVIAKLVGCKVGNYFYLEIREGEGLGHIERWAYACGVQQEAEET